MDDTVRLRYLDDLDQADRMDKSFATMAGAPSLVLQTKTVTTYPTNASRYFACSPVLVTGPESEGGTGTTTVDTTTTIYAYNIGSAIPASGTNVLASFTGTRWVFRYD